MTGSTEPTQSTQMSDPMPLSDLNTYIKMISCPLTGSIFKKPVIALDGFFYEKAALVLFLGKNRNLDSGTVAIFPSGKKISFFNDNRIRPHKEHIDAQMKRSDLMDSTVKVFLSTHPDFSNKVFNLEAYKYSLKIDFARECFLDESYPNRLPVGFDDITDPVMNHKNFDIRFLMHDTSGFSAWFTPIEKYVVKATESQLRHIISNLSYEKAASASAWELQGRFMTRFIIAFSEKIKSSPHLLRNIESGRTFPEGNTYGVCEMTLKQLFNSHPLLTERAFANPKFNSEMLKCERDFALGLFKCGFKFDLQSTLELFSTFDLELTPEQIANCSAKGNELAVIDAILSNENISGDLKIRTISTLRLIE